MLIIAASICFVVGLIHSALGERFILMRLFRRDNIPQLFGGDAFTKGTLRFAWHITTFAWWGFGVLLWSADGGQELTAQLVLNTIAWVALASGVFAFLFTKGRHLSWIAFGLIDILIWRSLPAG